MVSVSMQEAYFFITCYRNPAFSHPALGNTVAVFNILIYNDNEHLVDFTTTCWNFKLHIHAILE